VSLIYASTTVASGVLTLQQCVPNTQTPWTPGSPVVTLIRAQPQS